MSEFSQPTGPEAQEQRISELEAMNASLRNELVLKQEALDNLLASHAKLESAISEVNISAKAAIDLFGNTLPPTDTRQFTPPIGRSTRNTPTHDNKETSHGRGRKLVAGLAVAAIAVGALFVAGKDGDNSRFARTASTAAANNKANAKTASPKPTSTHSKNQSKEVAQANTAPNISSPRATNLAKAEAAPSVAESVKILHSTPENVKSNIHAIFNEKSANTLDHTRGAMSSMLKSFNVGELGRLNSAEAVAYSVKGSPAYAAKVYNVLHGDNRSNVLPSGVTNSEALNSIEQMMTAEGSKFAIEQPTGTFLNHGQKAERVFDANIVGLKGDKDVFTITTAAGNKIYFKIFNNNCANILTPVKISVKQPTPTPSVPKAPNVPNAPQTPNVPHRPGKKPVKPVTPNKPGKTPTKPVRHPKPKTDHNTTPAGVPGEPGSSGGNGQEQSRPVAGNAPVGVGQEQQALPTAETPQHNEATPTGPAETGVDPGTTGPAEQGNPGTTTPAGQINSGTTPVGE